VAQRSVPRPAVISSEYFRDSNVIDSHNQGRQGVLQLEKHWITQDCWFRIATTLIAMTVTDTWRAYKHALPHRKCKELPLKEFADRVAYDCVYNPYSDVPSLNGYLPVVEDDETVPPASVVGGRQSDVSNVTDPTELMNPRAVMEAHPFNSNAEREQGGTGRPIRRICKAPGCKKPTPKMCYHRQCLQFSYMSSHGLVRGVFYCPVHQYMHYAAVLVGNGNV
jgi:hypothetical protein